MAFPKITARAEILNVFISLGLALLVTIWLYQTKFAGQITGFFRIGSVLPLSPLLDRQQTLIYPEELGYDGQQFLSIALDPWLSHPGTIAALDQPSYRYRRILYPFLGHILGLGQTHWIPYALVALNVVAIAVLIGIVSLYYRSHRQPVVKALWGLAIPGVWMVLSLSTADLLASCWALAALYGGHRHRFRLSALCISLGLLTRETLLIIWLAMLLNALWRRQQNFLLPWILALVPPLLWNIYVASLHLSGGRGGGNFGFPLQGIGGKFASLITTGWTFSNLYEGFVWLLLILAFALSLGCGYYFATPNRSVLIAVHLYLGLAIVSSSFILNYYLNYSRVFMDVYWLGLLLIHDQPFPQKTLFFSSCALASGAFIFWQS
jgi:hypothetical protein